MPLCSFTKIWRERFGYNNNIPRVEYKKTNAIAHTTLRLSTAVVHATEPRTLKRDTTCTHANRTSLFLFTTALLLNIKHYVMYYGGKDVKHT